VRKKSERERKEKEKEKQREKENIERKSLDQKIWRDPSPLQIFKYYYY